MTFEEELREIIENDDNNYGHNYEDLYLLLTEKIQTVIPDEICVCKYRWNNQSRRWYLAVLLKKDKVDDSDVFYSCTFVDAEGKYETFKIFYDDVDYIDTIPFIADLPENFQVIKKCNTIFEAFEKLRDCVLDGQAVLKEI